MFSKINDFIEILTSLRGVSRDLVKYFYFVDKTYPYLSAVWGHLSCFSVFGL